MYAYYVVAKAYHNILGWFCIRKDTSAEQRGSCRGQCGWRSGGVGAGRSSGHGSAGSARPSAALPSWARPLRWSSSASNGIPSTLPSRAPASGTPSPPATTSLASTIASSSTSSGSSSVAAPNARSRTEGSFFQENPPRAPFTLRGRCRCSECQETRLSGITLRAIARER